ncbi:MAG TPA: energy transducer TonB, partial [Longimicrobiales bacterium]
PFLREAGIGGTVIVWFFIDETGTVRRTLIKESSGYEALDQAALKVADIMQFTPALNLDQKVKVWIQIPIVFRTVQ